MKTLIWPPRAQTDLARIDAYYRPLNSDFAQRILIDAITAAEFLLSHPKAGPEIEGKRQRRWRVAGSPYSLIYRESRNGLRIVTVRHAAQDQSGIR